MGKYYIAQVGIITMYGNPTYRAVSTAWLVVSNMKFMFNNIWDVILSIDELIFSR